MIESKCAKAWKLVEVSDSDAPKNQQSSETQTQIAAAAQQDVPKSPMTGDIFEADNIFDMVGWTAVCGSVLLVVTGVLGERLLYRRRRMRKDDSHLR